MTLLTNLQFSTARARSSAVMIGARLYAMTSSSEQTPTNSLVPVTGGGKGGEERGRKRGELETHNCVCVSVCVNVKCQESRVFTQIKI